MPPATQSIAPVAAKPNAKVLRLGLIKEGKVSERITKLGEVVGVGESQRNLFQISDAKLGQRLEMFIPQREGYLLQVPDWVEGMIQTKDGMKSLKDLRSTAQKKGDLYVYLLDDKMRGKLVIGTSSILFQFVPAPPQPERAMSASDFRAKFYDDEDPLFLALLGTLSVVAAAFLCYLAITPRPDDSELVTLDDVTKLLDKDIKPIAIDVQQPQDDGNKPAEDKPKDKPAPKDDKSNQAPPQAATPQSAAQQVAQKSLLLQALGTTGVGTTGDTAVDILGDQAAIQGLDHALAGVTGAQQADASNIGKTQAGGAGGRGDVTVGVATAGGGTAAVGGNVEVKVKRPVVAEGEVSSDADAGTVGQIKSVVSKRNGTFASCDQTALKQNPDLKGRIVVGWSINAGKVGNVHVVTNSTGDDQLGTCFATVVRGLRFDPSITQEVDGYTWAVSGAN